MGNNFGPGVSGVSDPTNRSWQTVIHQAGRPPTDLELNLLQQISTESQRLMALRGTPSGWLCNETNTTASFTTDPQYSNWFRFGKQGAPEYAVVNGWLVSVTGTRTGAPPGSPNNTDTWNKICLDPPPASAGLNRIDFAFLEVWLARVAPSPSVLNKPSASAIWYSGGVESGHSFLPDDLQITDIGEETTQRVQVQYRIRVVPGMTDLVGYPDGFAPSLVLGQGAMGSPTSYTFQNQRVNDDPGLWRAGDGSGTAQTALGTVDGYTYAVPLCAVFRRNGVAWLGDPSPNLNGAFNRNPTAVDRTGVRTFTAVPTLSVDLTASALVATLTGSAGLPLPVLPATPVLLQIGDELMTYSALSGTTLTLVARGVYGSRPEAHKAGSPVTVLAGRPDGLFADQIARTDILDLRHAVNPNGFNYDTLLRTNLDKLLKGELRANWKRTGSGPQGPFCLYQDKVVSGGGGVASGIQRLDGPDGIRTVWSDAAVPQKITLIANPPAAPGEASAGWGLGLTINQTAQNTALHFNPTDILVIPILQFKTGLAGGDADQVRFLNDGFANIVSIRIDGQPSPLSPQAYTATPTNPTSSDDLTITLNSTYFPLAVTQNLIITVHVQYGPGRGVARRPDSFHQAAFVQASSDTLVRPTGVPSQYLPMHVGWLPLCSKFRNTTYKGVLPVMAESYADLGSKTSVLTPIRRIALPDGTSGNGGIRAMDGTYANANTPFYVGGASLVSFGSDSVSDATLGTGFAAEGVVVGDTVLITNGTWQARYYVRAIPGFSGPKSMYLDRAVPADTSTSYTISHSQGLMPLLKLDGVTPKWATTDPLGLFSNHLEGTAATRNIYATIPRDLVPGWGEYHVPILWADTASFAEGINYMCLSPKGVVTDDKDLNYVAYSDAGVTFSTLSTWDNPAALPASYNTKWADPGAGRNIAGMRQFTDLRGLGREGLELPPFYGIARLFAVYEAGDFYANGGSYDPTTRAYTGPGGAANLLRQNVSGPTFWIEKDDDGDSTFILNADCLDLTKSTVNPIAAFASGHYVIEVNLFGFDRGSFDLDQEFRLVLTRARGEAANIVRAENVPVPLVPGLTANVLTGPDCVLPAPLKASEEVLLTYSRTPYQGDAWGSQTTYTDIPQHTGPLTTGTAWQLVSLGLDPNALTRPNQKALEVLASMPFTTTLGTGRISGDSQAAPIYDARTVGYEDPLNYPPSSSIADRPRTLCSTSFGDSLEVGSELLGCTERLPLGSLFRDKDFRGESFVPNATRVPFLYGSRAEGMIGSSSVQSTLEQTTALADEASLAAGAPGSVVVHVDGEQSNYALLTNFRTYRGGSAFMASGRYPGGEVVGISDPIKSLTGHTNVLTGMAYLVRNTVTSVGAQEVSAGDELMLFVTTTVMPLGNTDAVSSMTAIGTNGSMEGLSAADLYHIGGRPLVNDHVGVGVDPATVQLTRKAF